MSVERITIPFGAEPMEIEIGRLAKQPTPPCWPAWAARFCWRP